MSCVRIFRRSPPHSTGHPYLCAIDLPERPPVGRPSIALSPANADVDAPGGWGMVRQAALSGISVRPPVRFPHPQMVLTGIVRSIVPRARADTAMLRRLAPALVSHPDRQFGGSQVQRYTDAHVEVRPFRAGVAHPLGDNRHRALLCLAPHL